MQPVNLNAEGCTMSDIAILLLSAVWAVLSIALVILCDRLMGVRR
jgi:hypothetical protein